MASPGRCSAEWEATSGFSGTFSDDTAEVFGTVLVAGHRSLGFRASLKRLAEF